MSRQILSKKSGFGISVTITSVGECVKRVRIKRPTTITIDTYIAITLKSDALQRREIVKKPKEPRNSPALEVLGEERRERLVDEGDRLHVRAVAMRPVGDGRRVEVDVRVLRRMPCLCDPNALKRDRLEDPVTVGETVREYRRPTPLVVFTSDICTVSNQSRSLAFFGRW